MKHRNAAFHQLLKSLPRQRFQAMVDHHKGDHRTRLLSCWDKLIAMLFCQLSGRQSLRDLEDGFTSKKAHHYHLGTHTINSLLRFFRKRSFIYWRKYVHSF
ncbi:MAG: hypothetical protein ACI82Z_000430 [Cellvibrionaceae bacterium]|jgi:hypothetical protein